MTEVELPGGRIVEFPDGMSRDEMRDAMKKLDVDKEQASRVIEAMLEAERRGILPADKAPLLEEARRRGLVPASAVERHAKQPTYEQLMDAARRADAAGETNDARRLLELAKQAQDYGRNPDGTYGQPPEGTVFNPNTGQMVDPALMRNHVSEGYSMTDNTDVMRMKIRLAQEQAKIKGGANRSPVAEFFFGDDDPNTQNTGEKIGSFLNKAGESMTFGLVGDEASAAVEGVMPGVNYADRRDHYRQQERQFEQDHPVAALGAELLPMAIPGAGAASWAMRGGNLGGKMLRGGTVAGAQGGTYGFMEGEGGAEQRATTGVQSGLLSAGIGAAMAPATQLAQRGMDKWASNRAVREMVKTAPTADDLTARASKLYGKGKARGEILSKDSAKALADDAMATLKSEGVMRADGSLITRDPDAARIVSDLQDLSQYGLTGNQVKPVREVFKAAAGDRDPARARIGKILLSKFDDAVNQTHRNFSKAISCIPAPRRLRR